ncbi:hypothetical protein P4O66_016405 [Electrophorus voltai]|uniref:Transmembrane protein 141 n=1 Tax=Electrophorus voltai TaxID=2609070 RepID=A0AAD9DMB9_9TELE|nr:hypothetical protein P4O66_016405 [Electrophorus voltai]
MVNIGLTKVDDALMEKHPGLQQYAACQSRAFMKGTCSFIIGTASLFFAQQVLQKRLPYPLQWNLLVSIEGDPPSLAIPTDPKVTKYGDSME